MYVNPLYFGIAIGVVSTIAVEVIGLIALYFTRGNNK